ncbi:MAG: hypothetical protein CBE41_04160 [Gammaproteobacteria bacterium TMED281]|nr:MAG: hypothetical protein CBE41_04160 [Gammaproteobacteria bacterium TMED281]|tara:strand:- start:879 stop:1256 length:378 start_codon:yes stop_codon:yes gene_type:complete
MKSSIILSSLPHTWLFDLDGSIVSHNQYKIGKDKLLPGVKSFFSSIPQDDMVILLTARKSKYASQTEKFLKKNKLKFDIIIYDVPVGERILVNDLKPRGLNTALSLNLQRDIGLSNYNIKIDEKI